MTFTQDEVQRMYAPFAVDEHQIREGNKVRDGKGIQWFVYLDRPAIQQRLEDVFPFEWEFTHTDATEHSDKSFSASGVIAIRGLKRGYNGAQAAMHGEHTPKGAVTDAFRRAASMWGVGFYLWEAPAIYTASYAKGEWDKKTALEQEAMNKFRQWYNSKFAPDNITPMPQPDSQPTTNGTAAIESGLLATKAKYIQAGKSTFIAFNTDNRARLYGRDKLRALGTDWQQWADGLTPGDAEAPAVDLPGPVLLTTEQKTQQQTGELYHIVTAIEGAK